MPSSARSTSAPSASAPAGPSGSLVLGLSRLDVDDHDAEHLLREALDTVARSHEVVLACTLVVSAPWRHDAGALEVSREVDLEQLVAALGPTVGLAVLAEDSGVHGARSELRGPEAPAQGALAAAQLLASRASGRAIVFGGQQALTGLVPIAEISRISAVEGLLCMGAEPGEDALLDTRGFVRPELIEGRLVLRCQEERPGRLVPWEPQFVHRCGGH